MSEQAGAHSDKWAMILPVPARVLKKYSREEIEKAAVITYEAQYPAGFELTAGESVHTEWVHDVLRDLEFIRLWARLIPSN